jgi:hypothetical protein
LQPQYSVIRDAGNSRTPRGFRGIARKSPRSGLRRDMTEFSAPRRTHSLPDDNSCGLTGRVQTPWMRPRAAFHSPFPAARGSRVANPLRRWGITSHSRVQPPGRLRIRP